MCINKGDSEEGKRPDAAFHAAQVIELNLNSLFPF
jgi:HEPN domain-containing protein